MTVDPHRSLSQLGVGHMYRKCCALLCVYWQGEDVDKVVGVLPTFMFGGTAGACSVLANTPVDVVKTRMQVCTLSWLCSSSLLDVHPTCLSTQESIYHSSI